MEDSELDEAAFKPAHMVNLSPIPSSNFNHRRLSSQFSKPSSPIRGGVKKKPASSLAWISLQGRLVGAEEATSAKAIGGCFSPKEAVAWELFTPIHRVLIVAVVAVAAAKCHKNQQILQLRKCVQLRDEILMSMQQKLDDLCEQMNYIKDQPQMVAEFSASAPKAVEFSSVRLSLPRKTDSVCTDCWFCDQRQAEVNDISCNSLVKAAGGDEMSKNRFSNSNEAEQEERRMSDLSDWASSVTSATDSQFNNLAIEQDIYNLKKECEEKDVAIKELSTFIRTKDVATSKRIKELEEVIHRKNTLITKLKKDMLTLEQKVVDLTRTRRRSFSGASMEKKPLPTMTDNLLYDMESPTSSSSDSDCVSKKQTVTTKSELVNTPIQKSLSRENVSKRKQKVAVENVSASFAKLSLQVPRSRPVSPLKEKSLNQSQRQYSADSSMLKQVSTSGSLKNNRRRTQSGFKDTASQKRWM